MIDRVLIVGAGSIGIRHLGVVREVLPLSKIMVFRRYESRDLSNSGLCDFVTCSMDDIELFQPQVAIVANPATFHAQIAAVLIDLGCHVLIEKPLTSCSVDAKELISKISSKKRVVSRVGYNLRFLESMKKFKSLIDEGVIGEVLSIRCEVGQRLTKWRPAVDYRSTVSAQRSMGGGVLRELSHEIDYLKWIFGDVVRVNAWVGKLSDLDINVEDSAHLWLEFDKTVNNLGLIATVSMDFMRHDDTRKCYVIGSEGTLLWDGMQGRLQMYSCENDKWKDFEVSPVDRNASYKMQFLDFCDSVRRGDTDLTSVINGLAVLEVIESAERSAKLGCFVNLSASEEP